MNNGRHRAPLSGLVAGQRVWHHKFRGGTVLAAHGSGYAERAEVDFGRFGVRTLAVAVARLLQPLMRLGERVARGTGALVPRLALLALSRSPARTKAFPGKSIFSFTWQPARQPSSACGCSVGQPGCAGTLAAGWVVAQQR